MIIQSFIKKYAPELEDEVPLSRMSLSRFVSSELGWVWRRSTTDQRKVPINWKDEAIAMSKRMAVMIKLNSIHPALIINSDQTGVHLIPNTNYTYAFKGAKDVAVPGLEDKRQITMVVGSAWSGDLLPLQFIFAGKKESNVQKLYKTPDGNLREQWGIHVTCTENHWSNLETTKQYVSEILFPFIQSQIKEFDIKPKKRNKPIKSIFILDCWYVHRSKEFRDWMDENYPDIILLFIPPPLLL